MTAGAGEGAAPLIAHVLNRLDYGGMETVLVNLVNRMGDTPYRHAVICLSGYSDFRNRLNSDRVPVVDIGKRPGKDPAAYARLWRVLRRMRPQLVNTYNIAALDTAPVARMAGCRVVHAEHGWTADRAAVPKKYRLLRRAMSPFVDRFVAVSRDLENWLREDVGIAPARLACIHNGVDPTPLLASAAARTEARRRLGVPQDAFVVGTVARLDPVKAHAVLIEAIGRLIAATEEPPVRLYIVGEGAERQRLEALIERRGLGAHVHLPGARDDIPDWLAAFDVFALPSWNEGVSIAALEAMAAALPVVATAVGGNPEVVVAERTGLLVPPGEAVALADALERYRHDPPLRQQHAAAGRARMQADFSLASMVEAYRGLYDEVLGRQAAALRGAA
ncbi:TIGR03088 family PEP-CTERM/XrtA system glycosyltransferase [Acidihalobacter ferrooxydans]|uniref:Sugar transferase n=1 Tax=Acidihalobacter ferrooxydans TaxID=1765967 RepID=A0A1P8UI31_9GAMM|nr:TIGR03088 family PEP-CTERM/XrtA system glycosyltransferase [Acidihalobacter ferrooxydans]APZ43488.1 hypothetical protein BW247_10635 [Acidihalobacter ferrooxydans]